jgi:sigma-E factor negative regulatory protein RseB
VSRVACIERWVAAAALVASASVGAMAHAAAEAGEQAGDEVATQWLRRMSVALERQDYDGVFSYLCGSTLRNLRVVHAYADGRQYERLVQLDGPRREVVRNGERVAYVVDPGDTLLQSVGSDTVSAFVPAFTRDFSALPPTYAARMAGRDRVADRDAVVVRVEPADRWRYGYRLTLDEATGLLLKSELLDASGFALEMLVFSTIDIGRRPDTALFDAPEGGGRHVERVEIAPAASAGAAGGGTLPWRPGWLPGGFRLASADVRPAAAPGGEAGTLLYTDGLTSFSVFVEPLPDGAPARHLTRQGATVAVTGSLRDAGGVPHAATVVGEIPNDTAQRVLESLTSASP